MATRWVKSLQCKSSALEDVVAACPPSTAAMSSLSLKNPLLLHLTFCANSTHALRDVVFSATSSSDSVSKSDSKQKPARPVDSSSSRPGRSVAPPKFSCSLQTLTELPPGHSSRRVVEIIFSTSWSSSAANREKGRPVAGFPGVIEMLFRIHNPARTVARFEEYRAAVRALSDDPRCAADGNEMMRFHCGASARDGACDRGVECGWSRAEGGGKKAAGIRTFAGSGGAHESAGGGAGRRAMLVCRVIAGRVRGETEAESDGESVSRGKGELLVFDHRAVLPCFLIIYKI